MTLWLTRSKVYAVAGVDAAHKTQLAPDRNVVGLPKEEDLMLELLNRERFVRGMRLLEACILLTLLARMKGQDILDNRYFSHRSPQYGSPLQMLRRAGVVFSRAGENLAKARDARTAHYRLLASDDHRENMLDPGFSRVGIGVVPYAHGVVVVQIFTG